MSTVEFYFQGCWKQRNLANGISLFRALLGLLTPLWWQNEYQVLFLIILCAGGTDWLDGWWARRSGKVTSLGKIIDPLADKIFTNPVLIAIAISYGGLFVWTLVLVNLLYDIDNTYQRRFDIVNAFQDKGSEVTRPVTMLSKVKSACLFGFMVLAILSEIYPIIPLQWLAGTCIFLVVWSWFLNRHDWLIKQFR